MAKTASKPQRHSVSHKHLLTDTWLLEISALVLAICSFIIIIVLLAHYDNHPQFQWNGVTLNAVVSVLATVTRVGIMLPVAESLAQWKWMHFSKQAKPLGDFDLLDDASRGSRGSLLLLWKKKSWSLPSIGAWIVLLSVAIEPFFQQILSFEDAVSYQPNSSVNITYASLWDGGTEQSSSPPDASTSSDGKSIIALVTDYGSVSGLELDFQAQAAILFGLSTDVDHINQQLSTTCPSGNCTWSPYMTLGVCSSCNDVTEQVITSHLVDYPMAFYFPPSGSNPTSSDPASLTTYSLPNGLSLNNRDPNQELIAQSRPLLMTARSNLAPSQTVSFKNATTLLWSAAVLRVPEAAFPYAGMWNATSNAKQNVTAAECALYLCVKEYNSTLQSGHLTQTSRDVASTRDPDSWKVDFPLDGPVDGYNFEGVSPAVDALYTNTTYFGRSPLTITVPADTPSSADANSVHKVSATQPGIDTLSHYISALFDDGTFTNASLPGIFNTTVCTTNGTKTPCGRMGNFTGLVIQDDSGYTINTTNNAFYPPVMSTLYAADLPATFAALAESLTTAMRRPDSTNTHTLTGQLGSLQTLLRVRWAWIALPLLCLVVSAAFLAVSVWESRVDATPLWKSGGLPYLAHGLDRGARERVQLADTLSEIEEASEGVMVRLHRGEDGVLMLRGGGKDEERERERERRRSGEEEEEEEEHEMTPLSAGGH